jgi:predicted DNA-binding protein
MVKVTYTLDDETVQRVRRVAARLGKPQSQVVREAVKQYDAHSDKLSDAERAHMLEVLTRIRKAPPTRPQADVDAELRDIRRARRRSAPMLTTLVASREPVAIATLVLYEWLRGPRSEEEIVDQEALAASRAQELGSSTWASPLARSPTARGSGR